MSAVRVRHARHQGNTYIYATNQTRWPIAVELTLSRSGKMVPLGQQPIDRAAIAAPPTTAARWTVTLAAGELAAIRVAGEDIEILDCKTTFAGDDQQLASIGSYVQNAVTALARLVETPKPTVITNAGFEQDANEGIPGWLTAQFPAGCVAVDSAVAYRGKHSVRLTGQAGHGGGSWMVSQVIPPPSSSRIAVSVRLRGEPADSARGLSPLVVRMALEGTVGGTPIRKTKSVSVPRNGTWSEPAERLEIALLPSVPVESLRLTIDLMSGGVVWVDEVSFFDRFMTSGEKTHLDHLVFLAAGGASRGDWTAASRLLDSHWSLELAQSGESEQTREPPQAIQVGHQVALDEQLRSPATSDGASGMARPKEQPSPGIGERLKSWLPKPVRF